MTRRERTSLLTDAYPHPVTGELLETKEEFLAAIAEEERKLGETYRVLWPLRDAHAAAFPPAELPRVRDRTATQEKVARCPRCGGKLIEEEA